MRRSGLLIMALMLGLSLSGCGKKKAEVQTEPETETEIQTEAETETETETEVQTEKQIETEKEDSMNKTRTLNGLVKSSDSNKLKIQTERGKELEFSITDADIQVTGGITVGSNVKVCYKGSIEGTNTSAVKVQMVKSLEAGETPVTEGELMTEAEEADPNAGAGTLEGTLSDLNTNRIVILGNDGEAYYFNTYGTDVNLVNGIQEGNYVTVSYAGDIYGPDLVVAQSITDTQAGETKAQYGPATEGDYTYINGTLVDCKLGSITIMSDDGTELSFDVNNASLAYYNGLVYGNYITLECEGAVEDTDTSKAKVLSVYDYENNDLSYGYSEEDYSDEAYYEEEYYDDGSYYEEYYDDGSYSEEEYYEE